MNLAEQYHVDPESLTPLLEAMKNHIERMKNALANNLREELAQADYDFHAQVITGFQNDLFNNVYSVLRAFMYEEIEKSHQDFTDITTIIQEHEEFVKAVRSGDPLVAQRTVRTHVASIKKRLENVMKM
jgi:DNA-binding FadR family transcriptional regulator